MSQAIFSPKQLKDSLISEIPNDWQVYQLSEVIEGVIDFRGKTPRKIGMEWGGGEIPALSANNVEMGRINFDKETYYSSEELYKKWMNKGDVEEGDIIMTMEAPLGNIAQIPDDRKYILSQRVLLLKTKKSLVFNKFLKYYLMSNWFQSVLIKDSTGTTATGIQQAKLIQLFVKLPPLLEQRGIAEILDTVDEAIAHTSSLIAKLKRMKAGLPHDLLTRGLDENGELRDAIAHPEQFKDSPLGRIPKDWEVSNVGNYCEIHNHLRKPISAEFRDLMKGHYPYYGPTGILDYINEFKVDGEYVLIGEDGDHFLKFVTQPMTLVVSGKFNVNNHAHILKGTDKCCTEWIDLSFRHRDITLSLTRQGAGRLKLNKVSLQNLLVAVPSLEEQIAIYKIIDTHEKRIRTEEAYRHKLKLQKQGLMQDLLTGRVRVEVKNFK